ncbi:MAG: GHKL domain-containing protein [Candidatus Omnitrophica bacterium]|nr:GHKL domain-containing protein [Candidatus Omnitrophota bacterium]MDE2008445.1 GHKL domain-containing protein [Candidatus Omnitrophota bacterium]MDE2214783.1 GHKL domain-containing protein [Candidatus Omnitrophota bacterium]MDE2231434.1 GHKL domain-containing protein [Candidatus Omnitrophota bacterium]
MFHLFAVIDVSLAIVLCWFFIQNIRLNRELKRKNEQLESAIKELKAAQVKLMDSGKKGAVAALSAGLLHQISQPITAIHGFLRFMKKEMDINSPFYKPVCVMDEQSFYIKDMLANLMELIRHRKIQKSPININDVIYKSMNLLLDELRIRRIGWDVQLSDQMPMVYGDALHLQQVFMNLVVNAMEAASELPHGALRTLLVTSRYDQENRQVVITVQDNGPGIDSEHISKIFDPFFSTKAQGSGIGLALCYDLINEHGGTISVHSGGEGTVFTIKMPCVGLDKIEQEAGHEAS